ncbi:hypothetical protein Q3O60_06825 [Alkalimonas collagenimarina]|uniref:Methyltransferase domain-containing protein n=1 Tax=Alkalimonas collagenimarina TaxID=400390 RepID=A0ABT9GXV3_9GAMM|nr:hypothetical protein [Alkalimonas collagenimarina]MDP4535894.1 hypothetical protein [Alkalimonas collagenimarina]
MSYQLGPRAEGVKQNIALIRLHLDNNARSAIDIGCNEGVITAYLDALGLNVVGFEADEGYAKTAEQFQQSNYSNAEICHHALSLDDLDELPDVDVIVFLSVNQQLSKIYSNEYAESFFIKLFEKAKSQLFFQPCLLHDKYGSQQGFVENDALSAKEYFDNILHEKGLLFISQLVGISINNIPKSEPYRPLIVYNKESGQSAKTRLPSMDSPNIELLRSPSQLCHIQIERAIGTRDLQCFSLVSGWHRFTATAYFIYQQLQNSIPIKYEESPLYDYYNTVQPKVFSDVWLQSGNDGDIGVLANMPLNRYVSWLPWFETIDHVDDMLAGISQAPLIPDWDLHAFGPQTNAQVLTELKRIRDLVVTFNQRGYEPELNADGFIRGYILKNGESSRFIITAGQHRLAVMAALGFKTALIKFQPGYKRVIDSSEVESWPLVKKQVYTVQQALNIFNGIFNATGLGFK